MAQKEYETGTIFLDGVLLFEIAQFSTSFKSGKNMITTLRGVVGQSYGSSQMDISISAPVPADGFPDGLDPSALCFDQKARDADPNAKIGWREITIQSAGKSLTTLCTFIDGSLEVDANSPMTVKLTAVGLPAVFQ